MESTIGKMRASFLNSKKDLADKQDLLLRLFESEWFNETLCLQYLYQNPSASVEDYLCNKLCNMPEAAVEKYLLQLVEIAVTRPGSALEKTFETLCSKSLVIASKVHWQLLALSQEPDRAKAVQKLMAACEYATTHGHWELPFQHQQFEPHSPQHGLSPEASTLMTHSPSFSPLTQAPVDIVMAASSPTNGPHQQLLAGVEKLGATLVPVMPPEIEDRRVTADKQQQQGPAWAQSRGQQAVGPSIDDASHQQRTLDSSAGGAFLPCNAPDGAAPSPRTAAKLTAHIQRLREELGDGEGVSELLRRSVVDAVPVSVTEDDHDCVFSDDELQDLPGALPGSCTPPACKPVANVRQDMYYATLDFMETLCEASSCLASISHEERQRVLRMSLRAINKQLIRKVRRDVAVWYPLVRHGPGHGFERIVRIIADEAVLLNSREKAPFMLFVEVIEEHQDEHQGSEAGSVCKTPPSPYSPVVVQLPHALQALGYNTEATLQSVKGTLSVMSPYVSQMIKGGRSAADGLTTRSDTPESVARTRIMASHDVESDANTVTGESSHGDVHSSSTASGSGVHHTPFRHHHVIMHADSASGSSPACPSTTTCDSPDGHASMVPSTATSSGFPFSAPTSTANSVQVALPASLAAGNGSQHHTVNHLNPQALATLAKVLPSEDVYPSDSTSQHLLKVANSTAGCSESSGLEKDGRVVPGPSETMSVLRSHSSCSSMHSAQEGPMFASSSSVMSLASQHNATPSITSVVIPNRRRTTADTEYTHGHSQSLSLASGISPHHGGYARPTGSPLSSVVDSSSQVQNQGIASAAQEAAEYLRMESRTSSIQEEHFRQPYNGYASSNVTSPQIPVELASGDCQLEVTTRRCTDGEASLKNGMASTFAENPGSSTTQGESRGAVDAARPNADGLVEACVSPRSQQQQTSKEEPSLWTTALNSLKELLSSNASTPAPPPATPQPARPADGPSGAAGASSASDAPSPHTPPEQVRRNYNVAVPSAALLGSHGGVAEPSAATPPSSGPNIGKLSDQDVADLIAHGLLPAPPKQKSTGPARSISTQMADAMASLRGEAPLVKFTIRVLPAALKAEAEELEQQKQLEQQAQAEQEAQGRTSKGGNTEGADVPGPLERKALTLLSKMGLYGKPIPGEGSTTDDTSQGGGSVASSSNSKAAGVSGMKKKSFEAKFVAVSLEVAGGVNLSITSPYRKSRRTPSHEAISMVANELKIFEMPPPPELGPPLIDTTIHEYESLRASTDLHHHLFRGVAGISAGGYEPMHTTFTNQPARLSAENTTTTQSLSQSQADIVVDGGDLSVGVTIASTWSEQHGECIPQEQQACEGISAAIGSALMSTPSLSFPCTRLSAASQAPPSPTVIVQSRVGGLPMVGSVVSAAAAAAPGGLSPTSPSLLNTPAHTVDTATACGPASLSSTAPRKQPAILVLSSNPNSARPSMEAATPTNVAAGVLPQLTPSSTPKVVQFFRSPTPATSSPGAGVQPANKRHPTGADDMVGQLTEQATLDISGVPAAQGNTIQNSAAAAGVVSNSMQQTSSPSSAGGQGVLSQTEQSVSPAGTSRISQEIKQEQASPSAVSAWAAAVTSKAKALVAALPKLDTSSSDHKDAAGQPSTTASVDKVTSTSSLRSRLSLALASPVGTLGPKSATNASNPPSAFASAGGADVNTEPNSGSSGPGQGHTHASTHQQQQGLVQPAAAVQSTAHMSLSTLLSMSMELPPCSVKLDAANEARRREAWAVYGERWDSKVKRLQKESPHGHKKGWGLRCVIVKSGDDCRQEQLAMQLIRTFAEIFEQEKLPLWVRPYEVLVTSNKTALIEVVPNALSIHTVKHRSPAGSSLSDHFFAKWPKGTAECRRAQFRFTESLAAYSIICYLLQIKDRHNGNILIDDEGHLVHIDFGFMLSNSPGGIMFENAPFKLTRELLEVMDTNSEGKSTELFDYFKVLMIQGFMACRKHHDRLLLLVQVMSKSGLPCYKTGDKAVKALKDRLALQTTEVKVVEMVLSMISSSLDAWRTRQYDYYQRLCNGIL